ncbi:hypothetical protein MXB_3540 [Myxobolus squamalis]|nr:hypothetical protein MXB_3540 [Myxobolus squamalis]
MSMIRTRADINMAIMLRSELILWRLSTLHP